MFKYFLNIFEVETKESLYETNYLTFSFMLLFYFFMKIKPFSQGIFRVKTLYFQSTFSFNQTHCNDIFSHDYGKSN